MQSRNPDLQFTLFGPGPKPPHIGNPAEIGGKVPPENGKARHACLIQLPVKKSSDMKPLSSFHRHKVCRWPTWSARKRQAQPPPRSILF